MGTATPSPLGDPDATVIGNSALTEWLAGSIPGLATPPSISRLAGGSSNILYLLDYGSRKLVLRRPPARRYDATSHQLAREIRLLSALARTDVPHPALVACRLEPDLIGSEFLVIEHVDGFSPIGRFPEPFRSPQSRRAIGFAMIEALARLARADWRGIGLSDFGKPEGFLQRQVDRWLAQLARYRSREIPLLSDLTLWLRANLPEQRQTALIHGDYSFPNVMIASTPPVRMAALVDWESATIGDPLLDLGHLLAGWCDPGQTRTYLRDADWQDMPTREELATRYAELTGFDLTHLRFYRALALFKLAIILEGAYARHLKGETDYAPHATLRERVPAFIAHAWDIAQGDA